MTAKKAPELPGDLSGKAGLSSDFLWGFATASYQIEGAADTDGRAPSIWDVHCSKPGKIADGSSGAVACDSYNRTAEDIDLLKSCGAQAYRFSLSWSRVIPLGGRNDPVNQKGLDHYVKFTKDLLAAGITPLITLFHWDLPQGLHERYGGMLNKTEFVADFANFAKVVFEALAPHCKHWITFNEPWCSAVLGYNTGLFAPGRTSDRSKSPEGNSATEPWIVGHSLLVAHGAAVKVFREQFKPTHGGEISIVLNGDWTEPWDPESKEDIEACERKIEFAIAWFSDPIYHGDYPASMRKQLGDRLPKWEAEDIALVHGSNDFYGMNTYCSNYIRHKTTPAEEDDVAGNLDILFENKDGEPIGPDTQSAWLKPHPEGFRKLLNWISKRNGHPKILVTENGTSIKNENDLKMPEILEDDFRVNYYKGYIHALANAVAQDGVNVKAYFCWSLLDNFEWAEGYETRFGVTYVDYEGGQKRYPKKSAKQVKGIFEQYIGKA